MSMQQVRVMLTRERIQQVVESDKQMPNGVKAISGFFYDYDIQQYYVIVEHDSFAEVPEGGIIPIWEPPTTTPTFTVHGTSLTIGGSTIDASSFVGGADWFFDEDNKVESPPKKKKWREFL